MLSENEVRKLIIAKLELVNAVGAHEDKDPLATARALAHVLTGGDPHQLPKPKVDYNHNPPTLPQEFVHLIESWGIKSTVDESGAIHYGLK